MHIMSYKEYCLRAEHEGVNPPPLTQNSYATLSTSILSQPAWRSALENGQETQRLHNTASLRDIIRLCPKKADRWFLFTDNNTAGQTEQHSPNETHSPVEITRLYTISPAGTLTLDPSLTPRATDEPCCEQAHIWMAHRMSHTTANTSRETQTSHRPPLKTHQRRLPHPPSSQTASSQNGRSSSTTTQHHNRHPSEPTHPTSPTHTDRSTIPLPPHLAAEQTYSTYTGSNCLTNGRPPAHSTPTTPPPLQAAPLGRLF